MPYPLPATATSLTRASSIFWTAALHCRVSKTKGTEREQNERGRLSMADIVLINPKFEISYWGMEYALPYVGKRANLPVAALPLLAALVPEGHTITLIDENVGPIDFDCCARADIVGVTGMSVQRYRMTEILTELKARGCFTVVGGPWVTVQSGAV